MAAAHAPFQLIRPAAELLKSRWLWSVLILLLASCFYESIYLHRGLNWLDESWPLYAAMRLHAGGALYEDVFWVFPPGHVLPAWIAYALDPPGIVAARAIYASFNVALVIAIYALGRRLMHPSFALVGALLVALAAPQTHMLHALFGYRYLVFPVLALIAFDQRLRSGRSAWMLCSGACAGLALAFRLTPAFAVCVGIGIAVIVADRNWRRWLTDWGLYATGLLMVAGPVVAWFAWSIGLERLWQEVVVHPLAMLQPHPPPEIPRFNPAKREWIRWWFVTIQFRAYWFLYAGYTLALLGIWIRSRTRGRAYQHALLLAVVVWGGVYFIRSLGRSDVAHMDSVIPPICLLLAHLTSITFAACWPVGRGGRNRELVLGAVGAALVLGWIYLNGQDLHLPARMRGLHPVASLGGSVQTDFQNAQNMQRVVELVDRHTEPNDEILNMMGTPLFHLLTGRTGPGYRDIVLPGTFLSEAEETTFLARLKAAPPAAVIFPDRPFDNMPSWAVQRTAPRLSRWVLENYRALANQRVWVVMVPRARLAGGASLPTGEAPAPGASASTTPHDPLLEHDP